MAKTFGNRWRIENTLDEGGQGRVFRVRDETNEYPDVAVLKRLKNRTDSARIARFKLEAQSLQKLRHPNVLQLIDFDTDADDPYIVTEYCAGGSLEDAPVEQFPIADRLAICKEIADGLSEAHSKGIVHRDVKPANVFLRAKGGPAVLGDFGLSYFENGDRYTLTEEAVGPRLFIAPELEDGRASEVSPAVDVYSLGKLVYWILSGKRIFSREKHKDSKNHIVGLMGDERFEHFNEIFDATITTDATARLKDAGEVWRMLERASRLFLDGYRSLRIFPGRCSYCGDGLYRMVNTSSASDRRNNLGFDTPAGPVWKVFACGNCGHMLWFRPDMALRNRGWLNGPFVEPYRS